MNNPLVTVLMANYNTKLHYLKEALDSIYAQTYENFEIVLVDDGSTNNPEDIYNQYDSRLNIIKNKRNLGVTKSRNIGLNNANGDYIFIMDSDDIIDKNVIEIQINYFRLNPNINVLGVGLEFFGLKEGVYIPRLPESHEEQKVLYLFSNYGLQHIATMIKKDFLEKNNIKYNEKYKKALDYGIFVECNKYTKLHIIPEVFVKYRQHDTQISTAGKADQDYYANMIRLDQIRNLGIVVTDFEEKMHLKFCKNEYNINLFKLFLWKQKIIRFNKKCRYYDNKILINKLNEKYSSIVYDKYKNNKDYIALVIFSLMNTDILLHKILHPKEC